MRGEEDATLKEWDPVAGRDPIRREAESFLPKPPLTLEEWSQLSPQEWVGLEISKLKLRLTRLEALVEELRLATFSDGK